MQINRLIVAGGAQQREHALRFAKRVGTDQVRALGKERDRVQQFVDLGCRVAVVKYRKPERRLRDEHIAADQLERRAGRVESVLVVARGDHAEAIGGHRDLGRAEHVARGMQRHGHAIQGDRLAITDGLCAAGERVAIAQPHQLESFLRRQHRAMTGACMIGMAVADDGPVDRAHRIDMKAARWAAKSGRGRDEQVLRAHPV